MFRSALILASLATLTLLLAGCGEDSAPAPVAQPGVAPASSTVMTLRNGTPLGVSAEATSPPMSASATQSAASKLAFVQGFEAGCERASAERKPMLVFFTAEWCHFCHQMADEAFTDPKVVGLADRFVCILVDADAEDDVCKRFGVRMYPTVQFLSSQGTPLNRLVGKKPTAKVMLAMQAVLDNVAARTPADAPTLK